MPKSSSENAVKILQGIIKSLPIEDAKDSAKAMKQLIEIADSFPEVSPQSVLKLFLNDFSAEPVLTRWAEAIESGLMYESTDRLFFQMQQEQNEMREKTERIRQFRHNIDSVVDVDASAEKLISVKVTVIYEKDGRDKERQVDVHFKMAEIIEVLRDEILAEQREIHYLVK